MDRSGIYFLYNYEQEIESGWLCDSYHDISFRSAGSQFFVLTIFCSQKHRPQLTRF